jgi:hypothetical protein
MGAWAWLVLVGLFMGRAAACVPCEFGREYEVAACVCAACTVCGEGEYVARGCEATRDTVCGAVEATRGMVATTTRAAQTSTTAASRAPQTSTPPPDDVDPALDHAVHAVLAIVSAGIGCAAVVVVGVVMYRPHRSGIVRGVLCEGKGAPPISAI